jgi:hypothetical protein
MIDQKTSDKLQFNFEFFVSALKTNRVFVENNELEETAILISQDGKKIAFNETLLKEHLYTDYFSVAFKPQFKEYNEGLKCTISAEALEMFKKYVYTDKIPLENARTEKLEDFTKFFKILMEKC